MSEPLYVQLRTSSPTYINTNRILKRMTRPRTESPTFQTCVPDTQTVSPIEPNVQERDGDNIRKTHYLPITTYEEMMSEFDIPYLPLLRVQSEELEEQEPEEPPLDSHIEDPMEEEEPEQPPLHSHKDPMEEEHQQTPLDSPTEDQIEREESQQRRLDEQIEDGLNNTPLDIIPLQVVPMQAQSQDQVIQKEKRKKTGKGKEKQKEVSEHKMKIVQIDTAPKKIKHYCAAGFRLTRPLNCKFH